MDVENTKATAAKTTKKLKKLRLRQHRLVQKWQRQRQRQRQKLPAVRSGTTAESYIVFNALEGMPYVRHVLRFKSLHKLEKTSVTSSIKIIATLFVHSVTVRFAIGISKLLLTRALDKVTEMKTEQRLRAGFEARIEQL